MLDAKDLESLINQIKILKPDYIVNCIGTLISQSNKDPQSAIFLNAYLPHKLASIANQLSAKLIHMSTDCVFSGDKKELKGLMDMLPKHNTDHSPLRRHTSVYTIDISDDEHIRLATEAAMSATFTSNMSLPRRSGFITIRFELE